MRAVGLGGTTPDNTNYHGARQQPRADISRVARPATDRYANDLWAPRTRPLRDRVKSAPIASRRTSQETPYPSVWRSRLALTAVTNFLSHVRNQFPL